MENGRVEYACRNITDIAAQPVHHPYASMNWIRFIGSLRYAFPRQQNLSPLSGPPG